MITYVNKAMRLAIILAVFASLSGCGTYTPLHMTKPASYYAADLSACEYEAKLATASMPGKTYDLDRVLMQQQLVDECVALKGWSLHYIPASKTGARK